jgi:hypothetical protein
MTTEERQIVSEMSLTLNNLQNALGEHIAHFDKQIEAAVKGGLSIEDAVRDYIIVKTQFQETIQSTAETINELIKQ